MMQQLKARMSTVVSVSLGVTALFFIIVLYASSSLRPAYIHLFFNLLIVAVGADSGILRFFFMSSYDSGTNVVEEVTSVCLSEGVIDDNSVDESIKMVCKSENLSHPSANILTASIIDMEDTETPLSTGTVDNEDEEDVQEITEMELFARAEEFIEKFYKQLKMQREEKFNCERFLSIENSQ